MSSSLLNKKLFTPIQVGDMTLAHRLVMAPLTRVRANNKHVPQDVSAEYYAQRAATPGTLLIGEATFISPQSAGITNAPGVFSSEQIAGWKKIVDAVHAQGSFIFLQLWHLGRAAHADSLANEPGGPYDVVSASDIPFEGGDQPREMTVEEIEQQVASFAKAARNFVELAGGDGVEIHSAHGYILQQFLETNANKRTDNYGGSLENRARFLFEVVDAVTAAIGPKKTGVRFSPFADFQGSKLPTLDLIKETYSFVVEHLKKNHSDLAYIHAVESRANGADDVEGKEGESLQFLRDIWSPRPFFVAGGYKPSDAIEAAETHDNSVIVMGRYFISNPDLVERVREGVPLTHYDRSTFAVAGPENVKGYTDYLRAPELVAKA